MNKTLIVTFMLVASGVWAQTSEISESQRSFTRAQAEAYALEYSYAMRGDQLELKRAQAVIWENVALGLPQVGASGNLINNLEIGGQVIDIGGQQQFLQFGVQYASGYGLTVDQLIFDGSYIVALLATRVVEETAQNTYEETAINTKSNVAQAYHLVLITERSLEITKESIRFLEQSLNETRQLLEQGFVEQTDVDQLSLMLSNLTSNEDYLENQAGIARSLLKTYMGIPINETIQLTDDLESLLVFSQDGTALLSDEFNVEDHISYRILETGIEGQRLNLRNEQVQWLPKVNGFYQYNYNYQSPSFGALYDDNDPSSFSFPASSIGLSVRWDLFQGGRRFARAQEARVRLEQLEVQQEMVSASLQTEYQSARSEYSYALNNLLTQQQNASLAKDIRERTSIKYNEGVASSLEFSQAERQYQDALQQQIRAYQSVLNTRLELEKVLGKFNLETTTNNTEE